MSKLHTYSVLVKMGGWLKTRKWHRFGMSDTKNMLHKNFTNKQQKNWKKKRNKKVLMWIGEDKKSQKILVYSRKAYDRDEILNGNHIKKTALEYVVPTTTHTHTLAKHDSLWDFYLFFTLFSLFISHFLSIYTNKNSIQLKKMLKKN